MPYPHLDVRRAVRAELTDLPAGSTVLVACSGGADSLSLAAALGWVAGRVGVRAGGVSVDHGLQAGSAARARAVAATITTFGLEIVEVVHVDGSGGRDGPEGNARSARYAALDAAAARWSAAAVLLGHTRDDQAETVLLGLARGSGARSLSGMPRRSGIYRRPLLGLRRDVVRAAVPTRVKPWDDPHNADLAFARSRVRHRVLPVLEAELGPGVSDALARTAELIRADADALDAEAEVALRASVIVGTNGLPGQPHAANDHGDGAIGYGVAELATLPMAVRSRVLRAAAIAAGCPSTDLTAAHVAAVDALITAWHGQAGIDLPGRLRAVRHERVLKFVSSR